jgi:hypothetical protein
MEMEWIATYGSSETATAHRLHPSRSTWLE